MKKMRLRNWVLPAFAILVLVAVLLTYHFIGTLIEYSYEPEPDYVTDTIVNHSIPVNNEVEEPVPVKPVIIKPVNEEVVKVSKYYYSQTDSEERQQESLIKYANIYMPNTGLLYSNDDEFDIMAVMDGKVTNIKDDEILGKIIEIEHKDNIVTIYQSVKNVAVKVGDIIKQGDIIAKSGSNKLENEKANCLHFEVYKDGSLMNPEEFYKMELN